LIQICGDGASENSPDLIRVAWQKQPPKRRREVLLPASGYPVDARPIQSKTRATSIAAIARGRRWLDVLVKDPEATAETIAHREGCSARKVNMTISLAFLSPALVKAALDGRLPQGIVVTRLCNMPAEWPRQHQALGLDF
jgi:site-specific DNA recombinase